MVRPAARGTAACEAVLAERGSSHHFEVWNYTLARIRERPVFGHGLAANLHFVLGDARKGTLTFPHDLYLSLLFYSGAVGLLIFLGMAAVVSWRLLSAVRRQDREWAWLTALWFECACGWADRSWADHEGAGADLVYCVVACGVAVDPRHARNWGRCAIPPNPAPMI